MLSINELKIPDRLALVLDKQNCHAPINLRLFNNLVRPIIGNINWDLIYDFKFYALDQIGSETNGLLYWKGRDDEVMFLGTPDSNQSPGDLIPEKSVLLGDFGYGSDTGIILDYRLNMENPRVLIHVWEKNPKVNNRWVLLSQTTDEFLDSLGYP